MLEVTSTTTPFPHLLPCDWVVLPAECRVSVGSTPGMHLLMENQNLVIISMISGRFRNQD